MMPFLLSRRVLIAAAVLVVAACDRRPPPTPPAAPDAAPADAPAATVAAPRPTVAFGDGFHKEEAGTASTLRWVRGDAVLNVNVPADGRYRLTFRPFTAFTSTEDAVQITANGAPAGSFSARIFDTANPAPAVVDLGLHAGSNELHLHSGTPEKRLGETDDRMAAYGLVVPVLVERAP